MFGIFKTFKSADTSAFFAKKIRYINIIAVIACTAFSGCVTLFNDIQDEQVMIRMEAESIKANITRLNERVSEMQQAQEVLFKEIADLRQAVEQSNNANNSRRMDIESRLRAIEQSWDKNKQEIVSTLSKRMADVMNRQAQEQQTETGVEHIVKQGETLSEIAKAYGVSVNAIIKANGIQKPDAIRAGQKLFIPGAGSSR